MGLLPDALGAPVLESDRAEGGGQHHQGLEFAERAIRLNPNSFFVHARCGMAFVYICEQERALASFDAALRLSPIDPE